MKILKTISVLLLLPASIFAEIAFDNSIFDYQCDVIDFSESGIQENVRSNGIVDISPMDLKEGDIFVDADGTAQKVKSVSRSGNEVTIETIQPELREVFQFVSIPEQVHDVEYFGEDLSRANSAFTKGILAEKLSGNNVKIASKSFNVAKGKVKIDVEGRFRNNRSKIITGFCLPYTKLDTHGTWKFWKWTIEYHKGMAKLGYDCDLEVGAGLGVTVNLSQTWNVLLFEGVVVDPQTTSGIRAELFLWPGISGKIATQVEAYTRIKMNAGGECRLDGLGILCVPTDFKTWGMTNPIHSIGVSANFSISGRVEAKFGPKLHLVLLGISVATIKGGAGPYFRGDVAVSAYAFKDFTSSANNKSEFSFDYGKIEVGICASVGVGLIEDKISKTIWQHDFPLYTKTHNK